MLRLKRNHALILIPIIIAIYFSWLNRYFYFDDALIYARYIENFVNGYGLVYNKGEYFNGLTSPLFTYLSIVTSYVLGDVLFAINFLSGLFLVLTILMYHHVFSSFSNPIFASIGSLFLVVSPFTYGVFGMETFLFIFLIGLSLHLFFIEKYKFLLATLALLILTRNEGIFFILPLVIEHFRLKRKFPKISYFILPVFLVMSHYIFNYSYYGAFLPETGSAKIWQGMSGLWGSSTFIFLERAIPIFKWALGNEFIILGLFILTILGIFHIGKKSLNFIVLPFLLLLLSFYTILKIPNYHWYDAPFIVFIFYFSTIGLKVFYALVIKYVKIIITLLLISIVVYIAYTQTTHIKFGEDAAARSQPYRPDTYPYKEIGLWLRNNLPEDASVAMVEIGIVGYFSDRTIIDILGLVNPFNAKFVGEKKFDKWLTKYKPDYILVHHPLWRFETSVKKLLFTGEYLEYTKFNMPKYKLLANKDLQLQKNLLNDPYAVKAPKKIDIKVSYALNNVQYHIDSFKNSLRSIAISGWAFPENIDIDTTKKYIVLKHTKHTSVYVTSPTIRKDVTKYFKAIHLDNSGFNITIPKKSLHPGLYEAYILLIDKDNKQYIKSTNLKFDISS